MLKEGGRKLLSVESTKVEITYYEDSSYYLLIANEHREDKKVS